MSDQNTDEMNGKRSFEKRVFAHFDALDARFHAIDAHFERVDARFDAIDARFDRVDISVRDLDSRLQKLEIRAYDTKPIWERALKEILETKQEIVETRRNLSKRLDQIGAMALENRADMRCRRSY